MISGYRKKDLKNKIHVLGLIKGGLTSAFDFIAMRTKKDKWEKPAHKVYMDFLQKTYWDAGLYKSSAIDELSFGEIEQSDKTNIWIFWYQGWDSVPQIVKDCGVTTEKYLDNGKYNVHYITKENYTSFVQFPDWIMEKVSSGTINLTKFSNMLRMALLYQFGGIWMDATLFITEPLDEKITEYPYYSIKNPQGEYAGFNISSGQWSTFFLTVKTRQTRFYKELLTLQMEYWRREDYLLDYFLFDLLIALVLRNEPDIAKEFSLIPINNKDATSLEHMLNERYDPTCWEKMKAENSIFKVTYKLRFSDSPDTYYNRIVNSKK